MLIKSETIRYQGNDVFIARNADDNFIVCAYNKVVALVDYDGKVYKRMKDCVGMLGIKVDICLDTVKGKKQVYEFSEREWLQMIEVEAVTTPNPPSPMVS